jgi:hypothetical protein
VRSARRGRALAYLGTALEALDLARALAKERRRRGALRPTVSWLDVKLGLRMMLKHPGITLLGTAAIAFGIFVGAAGFELISQVAYPHVPFPQGDRIVGLRLWDASRIRTESRALHDLASWREELTTVEELGAYRTVPHKRSIVRSGDEVENQFQLHEHRPAPNACKGAMSLPARPAACHPRLTPP